ncbi:MAG: hypothetical protein GC202_08850 [Alphaproteobacteria bacterium]|nr:hypothetical protein [Alphaproteobacteria bacterium]
MPRWRNTIGLLIFTFAYGTTVPLNDWFAGTGMKSFTDYAELPLIGLLVLVPIGIWMDRRAQR